MRLPGKLIRGPIRPDRRCVARFLTLRWAALPIVDRRWTAPMAAAALGFGLFVGVAIGPGTQGTQGASGPISVQVAEPPPDQTATVPSDTGNGSGAGKPQEGSRGGDDTGSLPDSPAPPLGAPAPPPATTPPITTPPVTSAPPITSTPSTSTTTTTTEPAEEPTEPLSGTVVHINPAADSYTIADSGSLIAIHSHHPPNLGKSIEVDGERLANGTYAEAGNRSEHGSSGQASFGGTVSFSDPREDIYTVSAPGVSLLVRGKAGHDPPRLGDNVEVRARIADNPDPLSVTGPGQEGCGTPPPLPKPPRAALEQVGLRIDDAASSTDVEAIVEGVCRESHKLVVSADDIRESGRDIGILVPEEFKLNRIDPGDVLRLTTNILNGGSLQLSTIAGDKGGKGADDPDLVQP